MTNPAHVSALQALRRGLCPECRSGRIFAGRWRMNAHCPGGLFAILRFGVVPSWRLERVVILAFAAYLLFVAPTFRWSRIIWIYVGERFAW